MRFDKHKGGFKVGKIVWAGTMGAACCCFREECEDFTNPNSSIYRNCICLRCFVQNFLHMVQCFSFSCLQLLAHGTLCVFNFLNNFLHVLCLIALLCCLLSHYAIDFTFKRKKNIYIMQLNYFKYMTLVA